MPYPANGSERQRQLSTSLSTNTPSQSKMMRSGLVITSFPDLIRAYTQVLGNNPLLTAGIYPAPTAVRLNLDRKVSGLFLRKRRFHGCRIQLGETFVS